MDEKREEYRGLFYVLDYEGYARESYYTLRVEDTDDNSIKAYSDQCLDEPEACQKAEAFIDGYLLGLEQGKEIGANNLRHDFRRLINAGAAL